MTEAFALLIRENVVLLYSLVKGMQCPACSLASLVSTVDAYRYKRRLVNGVLPKEPSSIIVHVCCSDCGFQMSHEVCGDMKLEEVKEAVILAGRQAVMERLTE